MNILVFFDFLEDKGFIPSSNEVTVSLGRNTLGDGWSLHTRSGNGIGCGAGDGVEENDGDGFSLEVDPLLLFQQKTLNITRGRRPTPKGDLENE